MKFLVKIMDDALTSPGGIYDASSGNNPGNIMDCKLTSCFHTMR